MPDIFISPSKEDNSPVKADALKSTAPISRKSSLIGKHLSSYLFMPADIRFETQAPGETIILLLRKHWLTNIVWIFISFLLIISPVIFFPVLVVNINLGQNISFNILSFLSLAWYLITFTYILVNFLLWYFTVSITTNERIIDIDFINLLNKKFAETRIARVEDVTMKTGGFIRSFFDYGDVYIQTAAKEAVFQFFAIPHPEKVVRIVNELMGKSEEGGSHE